MNGKVITVISASAIAITIPALPAGFTCMIVQLGAGTVRFVGSGTTILTGRVLQELPVCMLFLCS